MCRKTATLGCSTTGLCVAKRRVGTREPEELQFLFHMFLAAPVHSLTLTSNEGEMERERKGRDGMGWDGMEGWDEWTNGWMQ